MARLGGLAHLECEFCKALIGCPVTAVSADRLGERIEVNPAPLDRHYRSAHYTELINRLRSERKADRDIEPRPGSLLGVSWT